MPGCDIIIDANQTLHFQRIDQIDWCALTGCDECAIVIAPVLLRELEHNKIFNPSKVLRERAARMIDFLVDQTALADPITLRPGVILAFDEDEPTIDFAAYRLVREVNDDHYIATAIERHAGSGRRTIIASNDGGMALKVRSRPIEILRLSDNLALEAEIDTEQRELREAKREIARLKSQRPKLFVTFADGSRKLEICNPASLELNVRPLDQILVEHSSLPLPGTSGAIGYDIAVATGRARRPLMSGREQIQRYNDLLQSYYRGYEAYLRDVDDWAEAWRLTSPIEFLLHNDGSATATDIDITVSVPDTVMLYEHDRWPKLPDEPDPPVRPVGYRALGAGTQSGSGFSDFDLVQPHFGGFSLPDIHDGAASVDEDDRQSVEFFARSLKQKCALPLDKFLLTRAPSLLGKGIELDVTITFHEGEPVSQKLALTFQEEN